MTSTTSETRRPRADDPGTPIAPASSGGALDGDMAYFLDASLKDGCEDSKPTSRVGEKLSSDNAPKVGDGFVDSSRPPCAPWPVGSRRGPVRGQP